MKNILPLHEDDVLTTDILENAFICTCCRVKDPNKRKYVYFSLANYDKNNDVVDRALKYRFSRSYMPEVIYRKCHNSLKKRVLPRFAVSSPVKPSRCNVMRCIICSLHLANKMHIFRRSTYGDNPKLDCALHQRDVQDGSVICQKCHSQFTRTSMYSCFVCNLLTQQRNTVEYNPGEFARLSVNISPEQMAHQGSRVCRACHARAKYGVYNCLVCCRSVPKKQLWCIPLMSMTLTHLLLQDAYLLPKMTQITTSTFALIATALWFRAQMKNL